MSIPAEGYPLAAAVSPRLHVVLSTGSTNALLVRAVTDDPERHPHLSVVLTRDQRAGRGRLDRTWTTPPDTALAISVLLRAGAVPAHARGWIPLAAGAAMCLAIRQQVRGRTVALKWPNDVLVDGNKISGILAEVIPGAPDAVVVGAGVNTTMPTADLPVPTATSFAVLGVDADEDRLIADFLTGLRDRIAALAVLGGTDGALRTEIEKLCATIGADVSVSLPDGTTIDGRAIGLDADGRLVVDVLGVETVVAAGDVVHVR